MTGLKKMSELVMKYDLRLYSLPVLEEAIRVYSSFVISYGLDQQGIMSITFIDKPNSKYEVIGEFNNYIIYLVNRMGFLQ